MSKDRDDKAPKAGTMKRLLLIATGALVLAGGGAGAGLYFAGGTVKDRPEEDPNRPKLVVRGDEPAEPSAGDEKEAPQKTGTVSVKSDKVKVDPSKYEITYYPIEQAFTANLSDGSGFIQVGISLATYYDSKVIANITRQSVPIRSAILMVLSEQDPAVLATAEGKQMLQRELTRAINTVLREKEGFGGIDSVYFSSLVIQ